MADDCQEKSWRFGKNAKLSKERLKELIPEYYRLVNNHQCRGRKNCSSIPQCLKNLGESKFLKEEKDEKKIQESLFRGLKNLNSTCYLNSIIQVLFHDHSFRNALWNAERSSLISENNEESILYELQKIFVRLECSAKNVVDPTSLIQKIGMCKNAQQDPAEFFDLFLRHFEKKSSHLKASLQSLFTFVCKDSITCARCGMKSETLNKAKNLRLQIDNNSTLEECLFSYFSEEKLEGDSRYQCSHCNSLQDAVRQADIESLPTMLCFQIIRICIDSGRIKKIRKSIKLPKELDMSAFFQYKKKLNSTDSLIYLPYAIIKHLGEFISSGHYQTYINVSNKSWFEFDDDNVRKHPWGKEMFEDCYMVFYKRQKTSESDTIKKEIPSELIEIVRKEDEIYEEEQRLLGETKRKHASTMNEYFRSMEIKINTDFNKIDVLRRDWITEFLSCNSLETVKAIDNHDLRCIHGQLDIKKCKDYKFVQSDVAQELYEMFGNIETRMIFHNVICETCIHGYESLMKADRCFKSDLETIAKLMRRDVKGKKVWIGKESFNNWTKLCSKRIEHEFFNGNSSTNDIKEFNSEILCEHGKLKILDEKSKSMLKISKNIWNIIVKYFPKTIMLYDDSIPCEECQKQRENSAKYSQNIIPYLKEKLPRIFPSMKNIIKWTDLEPEMKYHILPASFYASLKKLSSKKEIPSAINVQELICEHDGFRFVSFRDEFNGPEEEYFIITETEFSLLDEFFKVASVKVFFSNNNWITEPNTCEDCLRRFDQKEVERKFEFKRGNITVIRGPISPVDTLEVNEQNLRKSSRKRIKKENQIEIVVASNERLIDVKVEIMKNFNISPADQKLVLLDKNGEQRILDRDMDNLMLQELRIPRNSLIHLLNEPCESEPFVTFDDFTETAGFDFQGTLLLS